MKRIIYEYIPKADSGVEAESNNPNLVTNWIECAESDFEVNYAKARQESYNGEVTVEDIPAEPQKPTQLDRVEAQATYTAMMTDTLLEG